MIEQWAGSQGICDLVTAYLGPWRDYFLWDSIPLLKKGELRGRGILL